MANAYGSVGICVGKCLCEFDVLAVYVFFGVYTFVNIIFAVYTHLWSTQHNAVWISFGRQDSTTSLQFLSSVNIPCRLPASTRSQKSKSCELLLWRNSIFVVHTQCKYFYTNVYDFRIKELCSVLTGVQFMSSCSKMAFTVSIKFLSVRGKQIKAQVGTTATLLAHQIRILMHDMQFWLPTFTIANPLI